MADRPTPDLERDMSLLVQRVDLMSDALGDYTKLLSNLITSQENRLTNIEREFAGLRRETREGLEKLEVKLDAQGERLGGEIKTQGERLEGKINAQGERMDDKFDTQRRELEGKITDSRNWTVGVLSLYITLVIGAASLVIVLVN